METRTEKIKKLKNELDQLIAEEAIYQSLSEDKKLAETLHKMLCTCNHTDGCGWYYDKDWNQAEHKHWLEKAQKLLAITDTNTMLKIVEVLH
jgi:hypothetical protein